MAAAHTFNLSTSKTEAGRSLEFRANLVYRVGFRTARATQRNKNKQERLLFAVN